MALLSALSSAHRSDVAYYIIALVTAELYLSHLREKVPAIITSKMCAFYSKLNARWFSHHTGSSIKTFLLRTLGEDRVISRSCEIKCLLRFFAEVLFKTDVVPFLQHWLNLWMTFIRPCLGFIHTCCTQLLQLMWLSLFALYNLVEVVLNNFSLKLSLK